MSHEIRTPINAILGYTELLEMGIAGPVSVQQRDFLARVRLSSAHLTGLITQVLDLAKVEAGQVLVAHEQINTDVAIAAAITLTLPIAQRKGVRIVDAALSEGAAISYVGDEQRVRQVLVNLLANAVKFTPGGGIITVVSGMVEDAPLTTVLSGEGPWSFIRVSDTGCGIPLHQQSAVFEPFVQGRSGPTRPQEGSGLGLTIGRRLARLMGGDLTLENAPGDGAAFTLWLPAPAISQLSDGGDEKADARMARALRGVSGIRVYGLAEIGAFVRGRVEDVLQAVAARLRTDPTIPQASMLRSSELEDHQLAFLTDIVQSLVVIEETGGSGSDLYRDGSEIQRIVSALHGRMRHRQGWTLPQLDRESVIVREEVEGLIRRHVPEGMGNLHAAVEVVHHLIEQGRVTSAQAYRQAVESEGA